MTRRLTDFAAGLTATAALVALLVVPPLLLARLVGWPLPTSAPTLEGIEHAVRTGIDPQVIVNTLAVIAWAAWAQIALAIIVETIALARNRAARRLWLLPGVQHSIGRLVATAALVITSLLPTATATAAAMSPAATVDAFAAYRTPTTLVLDHPATTRAESATPTHSTASDAPADEAAATVTVEHRDSYWAIAERVYGDGTRWREIRDHNVGRTMPDGATIAAGSEIIRPGWLLHLPPNATTPAHHDTAIHTHTEVETVADNASEATSAATVEAVTDDSFWKIAQTHLANVMDREPTERELTDYWRELIAANRDRLVTGDPNLIFAGQQFTLPPITTPPATEPTTTPDPAAAPVTPPEPDTDNPPDAPATTTPTPPTNPATPPPPHDPAPSTTVPAEPAPAAPTVVEVPTDDPSPQTPADSDSRAGVIAAGIGALGIAAAGLGIGITRALRRRQLHAIHLHPHTNAAPIERNADETAVLRAAVIAADTDHHDDLAAALDHLAVTLATTGTASRPRVVQHGADHLDVLLTTAHTPGANGWRAEANGTIWTCSTDDLAPLDEPSTGWGPAAPLLVTLGQPDDTDGQLYLDLEAATMVCLTGDTHTATALARSVVTELAYSPFAERINLILIGDLGTHAAARLDRVTVHDTWDGVLHDVAAWAEQSHHVHTQHDWPNSFVARAHHDHDALTPLAIVATTAPDDYDLLDRLAAFSPAAIAVVAIAPALDGATVVDCEPDQLTIRDLGLTCQPQTLTPDTLEGIVGLLDHADPPTSEPAHTIDTDPTATVNTSPAPEASPPTPPSSNGDTPPLDGTGQATPPDIPEVVGTSTPYVDPAYEVLVRCLGDIRVEHDGDRQLTAKQTATVAYIALHQPVSIDRLEDAVWTAPTTGPRRKRLANTVSDCRTILGARNLPVATSDGRYTTAPTVVTDLELFDRRVAHAATQPPGAAIETLRGALAMVTGPVFTYRSPDRHSYTWVDLDNWVSRWEPKIAAVAQHLAQLCLDCHDPTTAIDTATHALGIVPTHTGLTETLMRAHHHNGDPTSVDAVYRAHVAALEQLGIDDVATSTADLYDQLHRTRATTS